MGGGWQAALPPARRQPVSASGRGKLVVKAYREARYRCLANSTGRVPAEVPAAAAKMVVLAQRLEADVNRLVDSVLGNPE